MQFLPDVHLECEACKGTRYKKEARSILFQGKSIVDVLAMTVDEALEFFKLENRLSKKLQILHDVGLGYLHLGQPSSMLSGGEAQRVKLATHLDTYSSEPTMFIFDEPTTGLHLDDISTLLQCFRRLTDKGHTVVIIEHNLHVIASADWVIDMGPEAGDEGGDIVAKGTPEQIAKVPNSLTGKALAEFFEE
jgi:excinuclease ABC subunit A